MPLQSGTPLRLALPNTPARHGLPLHLAMPNTQAQPGLPLHAAMPNTPAQPGAPLHLAMPSTPVQTGAPTPAARPGQDRARLRAAEQGLRHIHDPLQRARQANELVRELRGPEPGLSMYYGVPRNGPKHNGVIDSSAPMDEGAVRTLVRGAAAKGREAVFGVDGGATPAERARLHADGAKLAEKISFADLNKRLGKIGPDASPAERKKAIQETLTFLKDKLKNSGSDYLQIDELPSTFKDKPGARNTVRNLAPLLRKMEGTELDKKLILWGRFGAPPSHKTVDAYAPALSEARLRARSVVYESYASRGKINQRALLPEEVAGPRAARDIEATVRAFEQRVPGITSASSTGLGLFTNAAQPRFGLPNSGYDGIVRSMAEQVAEGPYSQFQQGTAIYALGRRPTDRSAQEFANLLAGLP
ncbi:MAG: hypothetical protein U0931_14375 [Vulcanimicrobiota bacterium]